MKSSISQQLERGLIEMLIIYRDSSKMISETDTSRMEASVLPIREQNSFVLKEEEYDNQHFPDQKWFWWPLVGSLLFLRSLQHFASFPVPAELLRPASPATHTSAGPV